jgi:lipoprotein-releasing system ATP-binding protein
MIVADNIIKEFGDPPQRVLHGISLTIHDGEFVSISGRSGSGKSTLLYILSSLDKPTSGSVKIDGVDVYAETSQKIHAFRNERVGFIFQFHYLLPELTVLENILLPARNLGLVKEKREEAIEVLFRLGLAGRLERLPGQLSGGEQQRVAIARALIMRPKYIFADEPTGNLDTVNGRIVMDLLEEANRSTGTTICLVTHDPGYSARASRVILLVDGRLGGPIAT